jgi:Ribonuclease HI
MTLNIYTDGSWSKNDKSTTYGGAVFVSEDDEVVMLQRYFSKKAYLVEGRNHGGELMAAMCAIGAGLGLIGEEGTLNVFHDYKGVSAFVDEWSPKSTWKESSKMYHNIIIKLRREHPQVKIIFHKVTAHTGNKWNELADAVANGCIPSSLSNKIQPEIEM